MCLNLLLAVDLWRQERAAWQVSPSLQSAGFLPPALTWCRLWWPRPGNGWISLLSGGPGSPGHSSAGTHSAFQRQHMGTVAVPCPPPPVTCVCTLQPPATIQLHSTPCLDIGQEYNQQIFRYSFYTSLQSKSTSVPLQRFFLPQRLHTIRVKSLFLSDITSQERHKSQRLQISGDV